MMNRRNRLRRAALVLALLVLVAIVSGVAESATTTVIPKQMTGKWDRINSDGGVMVIGRRGKVNVTKHWSSNPRWYQAKFNVTAQGLTISGPRSCSGTGRYLWTIYQGVVGNIDGWYLSLTKIHDACKARVYLFAHSNWGANPGGRSLK
jgi:hypothetical protein